MPAAPGFDSGIVIGFAEICWTLFSCRILYAASMSRTTMAICSNHSSLLYEGTGIGRPVGGEMYCVSSTICSPNFKWTIRIFVLNTPSILSYSLPITRKSATFSNDSTLVKKAVSRSTSATVNPIIARRSTSPGRRSRAWPALPDNVSASTRIPAAKEALGKFMIPPTAGPRRGQVLRHLTRSAARPVFGMLHIRHRCSAHCNDEPRPSPGGEEVPRPIQHDEEPVSESDEKKDVCEAPQHPGRKAAELDAPELYQRVASSDGCQHPVVPVVERGNGPPGDAGGDHLRDIGTLLFGHRSDAGKRLPPDTSDQCRISEHEDMWTSGQREVRLDLDPPRPIGLHAEPSTGGRSLNTRRPHDRPAFDPLGSHGDARFIAPGHRSSHANFGTQLFEGSLSRM